MSLRPLATAVQSSPRVLLFLFESKDALVRALLARARADEVQLLEQLETPSSAGLARAAGEIWGWLAARRAPWRCCGCGWRATRARSWTRAGPWSGFAEATVRDWLALLADAQPAAGARYGGRAAAAHARRWRCYAERCWISSPAATRSARRGRCEPDLRNWTPHGYETPTIGARYRHRAVFSRCRSSRPSSTAPPCWPRSCTATNVDSSSSPTARTCSPSSASSTRSSRTTTPARGAGSCAACTSSPGRPSWCAACAARSST